MSRKEFRMVKGDNRSSPWTRVDRVTVAVWLAVMTVIAILPVFGLLADIRRVGWGAATMAFECFAAIRTIQVRRYFCTEFELWGFAATYAVFFALFQWR